MFWILFLANWITYSWFWSSFLLRFFKSRMSATWSRAFVLVVSETRPFYLPAYGVLMASRIAHGDMHWWSWIADAINLMSWFWIREDDDRWMRRRKKLAEKIELVNGRLKIVPNSA